MGWVKMDADDGALSVISGLTERQLAVEFRLAKIEKQLDFIIRYITREEK
jgi:hypothetical protein